MSQQLVRALIETRLRNWAEDNDVPVAWENTAFDAPTGAYLRFNLLPAQTRSDDLAGTFRTWSGIVQVAICTPLGNGPAVADQYVSSLDALFPCGANIDSNPAVDLIDLTVLVVTPLSEPPGFADNAHWVVPAYFQYRCDFVIGDLAGTAPPPPPDVDPDDFTADSTLWTADLTSLTADQDHSDSDSVTSDSTVWTGDSTVITADQT